jgi:hypothetical protein
MQFDLRDVHTIESYPWKLSSEGELERFRDLLVDSRRSLPVYLLTQPNEEMLGGLHTAPFLLDADDLARRTFGLAHVVTLPSDLGFRWTNLVGKQWSAYLGAVRTYRPGLRFEEDAPTDHPLKLAERVLAFQYRELKSEAAFADFLEDQALLYSATKRMSWSPCLFYADAVRLRAERTILRVKVASRRCPSSMRTKPLRPAAHAQPRRDSPGSRSKLVHAKSSRQ